MMAIYYLGLSRPPRQIHAGFPSKSPFLALIVAIGFPLLASAAKPNPNLLVHSNYARRVYLDKQSIHQDNPNDVRASWEYAKACFDYADFSKDQDRRESLALQGIQASRQALKLDSSLAFPHYTLALNLGQLARTRTLSALQIVQEMEREFLKAIAIDPKIDHAGPHRALGILYRDAPGWPVSLGNHKKSRQHLSKASQLFPNYPGNVLSFLELLVEDDEHEKVCQQIPATEKILAEARKNLTGPAWASSWDEWQQRWSEIKASISCD